MLGTIQLAFFKQFWTKNFSDINLMLGGLILLSVSQFLVINVGPVSVLIACVSGNMTCFGSQDGAIPLWSYLLALYCMYSFGYPITNSAVAALCVCYCYLSDHIPFFRYWGRSPLSRRLGSRPRHKVSSP